MYTAIAIIVLIVGIFIYAVAVGKKSSKVDQLESDNEIRQKASKARRSLTDDERARLRSKYKRK